MVDKKYDIIIVGSGLGGLICANILTYHGYSVCILEKNSEMGGCLQDFRRDGCHFDTGIHYIGSYNDGQVLKKIFDYLKISDLLKVEKLADDAFDTFNINGKLFDIPQGVDNYKNKLIEKFPEEKKAIEIYINKMLEIVNSEDLLNLRRINEKFLNIYDELGINAYDYICSLTKNKDLINILSALNVLSNNEKSTATLHYHMIISNFYIESAYKVIGGGHSIAKALFSVAQNRNAEIFLNSEVNKVNTKDKLITSVELKNGEKFYADAFISDIPPLSFVQILPPKTFRNSFVHRLEKFKNSISVFTLYLSMKDKELEYKNSNYYYYNNSNVLWNDDDMDKNPWPTGFSMFFTEDEENKGYTKSIVIISQIKFNVFKKWENTSVGERGQDYEDKKEELAKLLLHQISEVFTGFKDKIKSKYSSTPLTYRDYTGVAEGGMYGTIKDSTAPLASLLNTSTIVKNLILTGQSVNLHGILGVALTAILSCGHFVGLNNLIREINPESFEMKKDSV